MTPFQKLSLPVLAALLVLEAVGFRRDPAWRGVRAFRAFVWLAAGVAIAWPDLTQYLANALGIGRGTDLVFYLFVLIFLGAAFYFYSRLVRMQRQITQLVRHAAIQEAQQGELTAKAPREEREEVG